MLQKLVIYGKNFRSQLSDYYAYERALELGIIKLGVGTYGRPTINYWDLKTTATFGKYCSIAKGVQLVLGGEHGSHYTSTYPFAEFINDASKEIKKVLAEVEIPDEFFPEHPLTKGDIVIGNDVWIGLNAMILSGVCIGNGAIIGAGAVVSTNVPDYAIVAGNPAKVIRYRFNSQIISQLNQIKWWDWPEKKIWKNYWILMNEPTQILSMNESLDNEKQ